MNTTNTLLKAAQKNRILIAAHRGICGGNIIQNTYLAYKNALLHKADIVEMDIIKSTDGVFYAFHNGEENKVLGTEKDIRTMSAAEIDSYRCKNADGHTVGQHLEKVKGILEKLRGQCFINIDRSWFYWKETIAFLDSLKMYDQIILKSPVEEKLLEELEQSGSPLMYMPIVKTPAEWETVRRYSINIVAAELIFTNLDSPFLADGYIENLHKKGILAWVNVITLNDEIVLSGLLDDNRAIADGVNTVYGKLRDYGFDIFQTDWPSLAVGFRDEIRRRAVRM